MPALPFTKVVGAPGAPGTYAPNTVIMSLVGGGYDLWVVNSDATAMLKMNGTDPEVVLTQAAYDALGTPDPDTTYYISG